MSESKEPMVFINWREVGRRAARLGFVLVAGLYYLAIVALMFEALHLVLYSANPPAGTGHRNWIHVASLVGLETAAVWLLTLVRKQRHAGEWSSLLTLFVLSMVSYLMFRCSEPELVTQAKTTPAIRCGSEVQSPPVAKPAVLSRR